MTADRIPFVLLKHQVPDFPESLYFRDQLRWCVAVMDDDDPQLEFAASMLSQAISKGTLTAKQAAGADDIVWRVYERFQRARLDCQQEGSGAVERRGGGAPDLRVVNPEGTA